MEGLPAGESYKVNEAKVGDFKDELDDDDQAIERDCIVRLLEYHGSGHTEYAVRCESVLYRNPTIFTSRLPYAVYDGKGELVVQTSSMRRDKLQAYEDCKMKWQTRDKTQ